MTESKRERCSSEPLGKWVGDHWAELDETAGVQGMPGVGLDGKLHVGREAIPNDGLCRACRAAMRAKDEAQVRSWILFALHRPEKHLQAPFDHFYGSTIQCRMCGDDPIVVVRLIQDLDGPYWGWYSSHHPDNRGRAGGVSMIWHARTLVECCFAYGSEAKVLRGHGGIVRLRAELVRPARHPENLSTISEDGK
jgi:hypothetical protein